MSAMAGRLAGLALCLAAAGAGALELAGTVDWSRRVELGVPVSGVVRAVHVEPGARVKKGDPLVSLDPRGFQAAVDGAQARVDRTVPALEEARRELERAQDLYDRTLLANHELQLAEIAVASADADHRLARAALAQVRLDLEYSVLRAPFDALVLGRYVEPGQSVVNRLAAVPMVALVEDGRRVVRLRVPGSALGALDAGAAATVTVDGARLEGRVRRVGLEPVIGDEPEPVYPVEVEFAPPAGARLAAGSTARVELP